MVLKNHENDEKFVGVEKNMGDEIGDILRDDV
jgi:hypothetical protein